MKRLIVTFGWIGLIPGMPGTYASFAATLIFCCLWSCCGTYALVVTAVLIGVAIAVGYILCPWAETHFGRRDPSQFVLDEAAGQWITLSLVFLLSLALEPLRPRPFAHACVAFLLFRTFDVAKPWPIRRIEAMPGGRGVILDDVIAAVYATIATICVVYVVRALVSANVYDVP